MTADARRGLKKCVYVGVYLCVGRRLVCECECVIVFVCVCMCACVSRRVIN